MKILSTLTSLTCKQVAIGSAAATTAGVVGFLFAASRIFAIEEANRSGAGQQKIDRSASYSKFRFFSFVTACIGIVSLTGAGLKGTYNWYRS